MADLTQIINYRAIDDSLATSGQPTEAQLQAIAESGFEIVINLGVTGDPRYSLPDEAASTHALGLEYVHIPVAFAAPTEQDLLKFCDAMDASSRRKRFVHCAANKRVTAFLGLYRVIRLRWDLTPAFEPMSTVWAPDATWQAFIDEMLRKAGAPG
ncbi:MAG: protein tyrosine phosphatase family protein [Acidobacteriota bacterium]